MSGRSSVVPRVGGVPRGQADLYGSHIMGSTHRGAVPVTALVVLGLEDENARVAIIGSDSVHLGPYTLGVKSRLIFFSDC